MDKSNSIGDGSYGINQLRRVRPVASTDFCIRRGHFLRIISGKDHEIAKLD